MSSDLLQKHIYIVFGNNMGLECAKMVKQQPPQPRQRSLSALDYPISPISQQYQSQQYLSYQQPRIPEITINVYSQPLDDKKSPNKQPILIHHKKIDQFTNIFKFVENVGFFQSHSQINQKQAQHQLYFEAHPTEHHSFLIELFRKPGAELWRKVSLGGIFLDEKDVLLIGDNTMKLVYWLTPEETVKMKDRSAIKLSICDDRNAECRICLEPSQPDNPLIQPCRCIGSVSAIHQKCLSKWIFNNPQSFDSKMCAYRVKIKNWQCEICKSSFKDYIQNRIMTIITVFTGNYAIFEVKPHRELTSKDGPEFIIFKFVPQNMTVKLGNHGEYDYKLGSESGKEKFILSLTMIEGGQLFLRSSSKEVPYILTESNYLNHNEKYKCEQFCFFVSRK